MSLLANQLDVRSALHRQVSVAAVNHICVIHEAMNSGSLNDCFENENILYRRLVGCYFFKRLSIQEVTLALCI